MPEIQSFAFATKEPDTKTRIDDFIAWAKPGGSGGFESHDLKYAPYDPSAPYFSYSDRRLPHSGHTTRSWFTRQEYLKKNASGTLSSRRKAGSKPEIRNPLAMIRPGRFLSFAKAYVNVYCEIRSIRSTPKPTIRALIFLEKALRDLNQGDNDPSKLSHVAFNRAALGIQRSGMSSGVCFDAGKALEHLAMLVQSGGRFKGDKKHAVFPGFKLLATSFSFRSPIKPPPKHGKKRTSDDPQPENGHLTSEEVAAVGLAYRRANEQFGPEAVPTFFAALMGLSLTTASMRPSELQSLRNDALYKDGERYRMRVPRPKIGIEQDVPVSKKLGALAAEIFEVVKNHSAESRAALTFYIKQSPDSLEGVHTLYIPAHVKPLLKSAFLSSEQTHNLINPGASYRKWFPLRLAGFVPVTRFVQKPGDIYGPPGKAPMVRIKDVIAACRGYPVQIELPVGACPSDYVNQSTAAKLIKSGGTSDAVRLALRALFSSSKARKCSPYMARDAVLDFLLTDFKKSHFPHWPYTSKDRSVTLDKALATHFSSEHNKHVGQGNQRSVWWLPRLLSMGTLGDWVAGSGRRPPTLFAMTDVKLGNGAFPSVSVQRSRRLHHTAALLAGANPLFANQLAGRQSGWQGEAYDYRTPSQIVKQSIDTYDPDQGSDVIGPIAEQSPSPKRVVERRIFLAENAAPKHVTEIGGCRTDWAVDPCDHHGDCIRCGKQVWRKGDWVRLPRIQDMRAEAARTIKVGRAKLCKNPRLTSIEKQVRQQMETLDRCNFILNVEADLSIEVGTLVTFPPAPTAMSSTQLRTRLRDFNRSLNDPEQ